MKNGSFSSFIAKEWRHILRERRTLVMLFAIPLALVLLFGYVISTDIDRTPIAVLDSSHGDPLARKLIRELTAPASSVSWTRCGGRRISTRLSRKARSRWWSSSHPGSVRTPDGTGERRYSW